MKKLLSTVLLVLMLVMAFATVVNATTSSTLAEELYAKGQKYGMTAADKVKIERYLADNPATEEEANKVMEKAEEAVKIMEDAGVTNAVKLSKEKREELKTIATSAAKVVDAKVVFKPGSVDIYNKEGKLIEAASFTTGKLAYTGNSVNIALVVSVVAIIALAITVIAKRFLNAK